MKKIILYICVLAIFFTLSIINISWNSDEFNENMPRYVAVVNEGAHYWNAIYEGAKAADLDGGSYTKWITVTRYNLEEQLRELENLKYYDIDGILTLGAPSSAEIDAVINDFVSEGIPVVLLDTDSVNSNRSAYVGTNNYQAGALAAQKIAEETAGSANCLIIVTKLENANQSDRYLGFLEGLSDYPQMEVASVLEAEGDKLILQDELIKVFEEYPNINAIFCAESASTRRLWPLLQQINKNDIAVIGFDNAEKTLDYIRAGYYAGTIVQSAYDIGYKGVQALNDGIDHLETDTIYTDTYYLTAEDLTNES